MARFMLDTDIASYIMKRSHPLLLRKLEKIQTVDVCVSMITKAELLFGVEISARREQQLGAVTDFLRQIVVLNFDDEAAAHYGQIRAALKLRGELIGGNDMLIAAHARSLGMTVATNNTKEFRRVPGLKLANWTEPSR